MADTLKLRGGNTADNAGFTGADREVTVDTEKKTLVVHDGTNAGGTPLMKEEGNSGSQVSSVKFATSGTDAIAIDSNQRVGIGESTMDALLVIKGNSDASTTPSIRLKDGNDAREAWISNSAGDLILANGGDDNTPHCMIKMFDGNIIDFNTANSSAMVIDPNQQVGIGISNPDKLFHVERNDTSTSAIAKFKNAGDGDATLQIGNVDRNFVLGMDNSDSDKFKLGFGDALQSIAGITIDTSGRLLIGTTTEGNANADDLTIGSSGATGMTIRSGSSDLGRIFFSDATSGNAEFAGFIAYDHLNNKLLFGTNETTKLAIDLDGNLGIGITDPSAKLHLAAASNGPFIRLENTDNSISANQTFGGIEFESKDNSVGSAGVIAKFDCIANADFDGSSAHGGELRFHTSGTNSISLEERLRIDADGHIICGAITAFDSNRAASGTLIVAGSASGVSESLVQLKHSDNTSAASRNYMLIYNNANTIIGSITANSTETSFNETSDYRLKENITAISDGITRLKTLKPYRFNFKADASRTVDGFLAHEVTAVPEAITGTKNAVDADNKPIYQMIDKSKLVPLLVAAVQELIGKVEALEAA